MRQRDISVADYTSKIKDIYDSVASIDVNVEEGEMVPICLGGLTRISCGLYMGEYCKRCRGEASMKTEIRKKENAGLMEAWSYAQYAGEAERERERENNSIPKTLT